MRRTLILILLGLFGLLVLATTLMLALGIQVPGVLTPITTLTGFGFGLLHAGQRLGWKKALLLLGFVFVVALLFESLGGSDWTGLWPISLHRKTWPKILGIGTLPDCRGLVHDDVPIICDCRMACAG